MARAVGEITHWPEYDYVLINRDFEKCLEEIKTILGAERLKRSRQAGLENVVKGLTGAPEQS